MQPRRGVQTKGQRLEAMARKREDRAVKVAHRKEQKMQSYLADDDNYGCFATQLGKMGLQIRDIPGDGNCLFRALGDQLEGHGRNHMKHRLDVVRYMEDNRADFEPFVEDDISFDRHISLLRKMGTYAGNDVIVAFARLHQVVVVIHQLNSPCWQIHGTDSKNAHQLHLTYHNGEHYSSVRRLGDNTESPATVGLEFFSNDETSSKTPGKKSQSTSTREDSTYYQNGDCDLTSMEGVAVAHRNICDVIKHIMAVTGFKDEEMVLRSYRENDFDEDSTIHYLIQIMALNSDPTYHGTPTDDSTSISSQHTSADSGVWSDNSPTSTKKRDKSKTKNSSDDQHETGAKPKIPLKISNKERKEQAKKEKKKRAEERHKRKGQGTTDNDSLSDDNGYASSTLVRDVSTLKI